MGYIYRLGHNGTTRSGIYLPGNIPLSNGGNTSSISGEGTRYLHCAGEAPANNIIIGGETLHCQGKKMSGNISIESVTAPYLNWANVGGYTTGTCCIYWSGGAYDAVIVRRNGTPIYYGGGSSYEISSGNWVTGYLDSGLRIGETYYYTVQPYRTYFGSTWYGYESGSMGYYAASYYIGETTFTYTQYWTCPTGLRSAYVFLVGGGGAGGWGGDNYEYSSYAGDGGGGAGGYTVTTSVSLVPGAQYLVTVAAASSGGGNYSNFAGATASGGGAGGKGEAWYYGGGGGSGGSGGGGGCGYNRNGSWGGGTAGSNGGRGSTDPEHTSTYAQYPASGGWQGNGQGYNSRAWGIDDSSHTLYSGGGGGGHQGGSYRGYGGSGGGARGGYGSTAAASATANTGGGGGGGLGEYGRGGKTPGNGGSGLVIIKS